MIGKWLLSKTNDHGQVIMNYIFDVLPAERKKHTQIEMTRNELKYKGDHQIDIEFKAQKKFS